MKALISAELIGDFIDQADALLTARYHIPAASLAGAVLEDTLRKLWIRNEMPLPDRPSIDSLSAGLVKAQIYNTLTHKQITVHADVRNKADHGHYDEVKSTDVKGMIGWVRQFSEQYLR